MGCKDNELLYLLRADGAVLVSAIAHHVLVAAGIAAKAGSASSVEQVEGDERRGPHDDSEAAGEDAVGVARANWAPERALEGHDHDGDGGQKIGSCHGEEHQRRRQVCPRGPGHGELAMAEVERDVTAVDLEGVYQRARDGAAEDHDEQAESRAQPAEPWAVVACKLQGHSPDAEAVRLLGRLREVGFVVVVVLVMVWIEAGEGDARGRRRGMVCSCRPVSHGTRMLHSSTLA